MIFGDQAATVPSGFQAEDFLIRPLLESDVEADYDAVMESREFLRKWEQSTWPEDDFTLAKNRQHLIRHEREHIDRVAFTFTVMDPTETECLGCIYIYPPDARWLATAEVASIEGAEWGSDVAAITLFWIRQSRLAEGLDRRLLDAIRSWFSNEWPFDRNVFMTNERFEQQVEMFEAAGLQAQFRLSSDSPGADRVADDLAYW